MNHYDEEKQPLTLRPSQNAMISEDPGTNREMKEDESKLYHHYNKMTQEIQDKKRGDYFINFSISIVVFLTIIISFSFGESSTCFYIHISRRLLIIMSIFCVCLRLLIELPLLLIKWKINYLDCIYKTLIFIQWFEILILLLFMMVFTFIIFQPENENDQCHYLHTLIDIYLAFSYLLIIIILYCCFCTETEELVS